MVLASNRPAVMAILSEIEPRILGKPYPGFACHCGAIHHGPGVAVRIYPGGDDHPGQETAHWTWVVEISHHPEEPASVYDYSVSLTEFIPEKDLAELFSRHFNIKQSEKNPYGPKVDGAERVWKDLPSAVRIKDNSSQTRFCFDWGREQATAKILNKFFKDTRFISSANCEFTAIITLLRALKPEVYIGGPAPVLPFESSWLLDYSFVLDMVAGKADRVFMQCVCTSGDSRGTCVTAGHIVFMKLAAKTA
jgi:hypothetical protein